MKIANDEGPAKIRKGDGDENTMNVVSINSGYTGHTGQTLQSLGDHEIKSIENSTPAQSMRTPEQDEDNSGGDTYPTEDKPGEHSEWKQVEKGKGVPPRPPTMKEKAMYYLGLQGVETGDT